MTTDAKTCSGHCCRAFQLGGATYEELKLEYEMWLRGQREVSTMRGSATASALLRTTASSRDDIHMVFPMLIRLGKLKRNPEKLVNQEWIDARDRDDTHFEGVEFFSCKHLHPAGHCTIYDVRPTMCRAYGLGKTCEYEECTWEGHKEPKRDSSRVLEHKKLDQKKLDEEAIKAVTDGFKVSSPVRKFKCVKE